MARQTARWTAALPRGCSLVLRAVLLVCVAGCGQGAPSAPRETGVAPSQTHGVAVYVLSRGQGVPEATRAARDQARALLRKLQEEKRALAVEETPMGLEGERRLCATFANAGDAADAAEKLRAIGREVELFNVVMEPCARKGAPLPSPGEKP